MKRDFDTKWWAINLWSMGDQVHVGLDIAAFSLVPFHHTSHVHAVVDIDRMRNGA